MREAFIALRDALTTVLHSGACIAMHDIHGCFTIDGEEFNVKIKLETETSMKAYTLPYMEDMPESRQRPTQA